MHRRDDSGEGSSLRRALIPQGSTTTAITEGGGAMRRLFREDGVSNIIEYSIVLPLCLIGVCFIFMVGYYLHQSAVLDAAAYRAAMVVQRIYNDPNAIQLIDFGTEEETFVGYRTKQELKGLKLERDPYRYFNTNYRAGEIEAAVLGKMEAVISFATLSPVKSIYVEEARPEYGGMTGIISKEATVSVTQDFKLPGIFRLVGLPESAELSATVTAPVISQTEFVRNAMFAQDLVEELSEKSETVGKITETVQSIFAKISSFFKSDD